MGQLIPTQPLTSVPCSAGSPGPPSASGRHNQLLLPSPKRAGKIFARPDPEDSAKGSHANGPSASSWPGQAFEQGRHFFTAHSHSLRGRKLASRAVDSHLGSGPPLDDRQGCMGLSELMLWTKRNDSALHTHTHTAAVQAPPHGRTRATLAQMPGCRPPWSPSIPVASMPSSLWSTAPTSLSSTWR